MARMEPIPVDCPTCGKELLVPVRLVPAPDTDLRTANFTAELDTWVVERHLEHCPGQTARLV